MLKQQGVGIVKLTEENGSIWYGVSDRTGEGAVALKAMMQTNGWRFVEQEGSGYFFRKGDKQIIITGKKWTGAFQLFKLPADTGIGQ